MTRDVLGVHVMCVDARAQSKTTQRSASIGNSRPCLRLAAGCCHHAILPTHAWPCATAPCGVPRGSSAADVCAACDACYSLARSAVERRHNMQSSAWLGTSVYTRSFDVRSRSEKRRLKEGGADGSGTAGIEGSVRGLVSAFAGGFRYTNYELGGRVSKGWHMRVREGEGAT